MDTHGTTMEELRTMESIQHIARNQIKLRDYFAGQLITAYMANDDWDSLNKDTICETVYSWADAMIKARGNK